MSDDSGCGVILLALILFALWGIGSSLENIHHDLAPKTVAGK